MWRFVFCGNLVGGMFKARMQGMKRELMFDKKANFTALPPGMLFMNRLQFGFYSVLARLDVAVDFAAIERQLLTRVGA